MCLSTTLHVLLRDSKRSPLNIRFAIPNDSRAVLARVELKINESVSSIQFYSSQWYAIHDTISDDRSSEGNPLHQTNLGNLLDDPGIESSEKYLYRTKISRTMIEAIYSKHRCIAYIRHARCKCINVYSRVNNTTARGRCKIVRNN